MSVSVSAGRAPARPIAHLRWWIVALLFCSTVINYVDRQTLSVLARTIQDDLGLSDIAYAHVVQAFLLAYTISYLLSGPITDRLGTRLSMAAFIIWWSLANIGTAFAASAFSLGAARFLLGVGEPGNYTAGPKAIAEWFTARERGLAYGIYTMGATLGATIAPPLIAWLASSHGWRLAFVFTGLAGLVWVVPWLWLYRPPHEHPRLGDAERPLVAPRVAPLVAPRVAPRVTPLGTPQRVEAGSVERDVSRQARGSQAATWRALLSRRETWLLLLSRVLTDPVWYFYLFWFPKYLGDARGLSLIDVGRVAWVVYLAADVGSVAGGWLSGRFIQRGRSPVSARKTVLCLSACLVLAGPLVAFTPSLPLALACAGIVALAHLAWQVTIGALLVDYYPQTSIATAFGIISAGSGLGGMISTGIIGYLVSTWSYTPVFVGMAVLHPLALLLIAFIREPGSLGNPGVLESGTVA